ncbi:60S acidic ribosomal protein P1 [Stygiomarasmius scandens]|uniref:60S acidic ribosomal protein P1 n=1 Tax=Marasmiellus scandens TaxID=2682957 RepID=A0ABR1JX15_9AGAR
MPSRHSTSASPYTTPSSASRTTRTLSPPISQSTSYSPTVTPYSNSTKLNVVTRVAIEGKAKQGKDGANIKMYLKISVPLDSVTPGSTIHLFPEENVKIATAHVHPLDNNSIPYNFSSTHFPLLHSAARALNLPARSQQTFQSAFGLSPPPVSASVTDSMYSSKLNGSAKPDVPPVDERYTGHIVVSGYHIAFALPKVFPPKFNPEGAAKRRSSIGERNNVHFMAAIDMWVTYLCRPPRSPYLLSIPTPRCLHNNIKLRIFPPSNPASSFASVSSMEEDGGSWEMASDPPVATAVSRSSRSNSSNQFADDESSDSSTAGFSSGCGIQGTFPSAERIRVRWARPARTLAFPEGLTDGRRRAGVKDAKGEMTCVIKGKMRDPEREVEGVVMDVEYKGTCHGVWFAGVATLLGLDVGLVAKNSDVSWVPGAPQEWQVGGGVGYTGFDSGAKTNSASHNASRHDSFESGASPHIYVSPSSPDVNGIFAGNRPTGGLSSRQGSTSSTTTTSSTSSLLRAPLPNQSVADYSFEGSASGTSSQVTSSLSSLTGDEFQSQSDSRSRLPAPGHPIALHLNMNELLPPQNKPFTFTISGTILVTPRPSVPRTTPNGNTSISRSSAPEESETDKADSGLYYPDPDQPVTLPRFTVLAADSESTSMVIRNDIDETGSTVEVFNSSSGDIHTSRKTTVQKGSYTKVSSANGEYGVRVVVKFPLSSSASSSMLMMNGHGSRAYGTSKNLQPPSRPRTPSRSRSGSSSPIIGTSSLGGGNLTRASSYTSLAKLAANTTPFARPKRDGPLIIPWVETRVTPLGTDPNSNSESSKKVEISGSSIPKSFFVRVTFPAPSDTDSDWVEFGLGTDSSGHSSDHSKTPLVNVVSVSVEGVPVKYETTAAVKEEAEGATDLGGVNFEEMTGKNWVTWIRVHVGVAGGGTVVVEYVQTATSGSDGKKDRKGKGKEIELPVYVPTFTLPVGRFEVLVESVLDLSAASIFSTIRHTVQTKSGHKLLHFLTDAYFPHRVVPVFSNVTSRMNPASSLPTYLSLFTLFAMIFGFSLLLPIQSDLQRMRTTSENLSLLLGPGWNDLPQPVTVTTTMYTGTRWWFGGEAGGFTKENEPLSSRLPTESESFPSDSTTLVDTETKTDTLPKSVPVTSIIASPSPSPSRVPSRSLSKHSRPSGSTTSTSTSGSGYGNGNGYGSSSPRSHHGEAAALVAVQNMFNYKWEDMRPVVESVYKVVSGTVERVWYTVRWLYHYPLPPPV